MDLGGCGAWGMGGGLPILFTFGGNNGLHSTIQAIVCPLRMAVSRQ